jgi:hypothetical protein
MVAFLTGWSVFNSKYSCIQTMIKSKTITDHKLLKDVHGEYLQNPRQKQLVPMQLSGRAFEGVRTPLSVQQITMKMSGRQSNSVRMLGQSVFNKELDSRKSTLIGKSLQAVRTTWQHVQMMSSISEYSRVPFEHRKDFSEDRPDARSSRPDVILIKIELRCF